MEDDEDEGREKHLEYNFKGLSYKNFLEIERTLECTYWNYSWIDWITLIYLLEWVSINTFYCTFNNKCIWRICESRRYQLEHYDISPIDNKSLISFLF